MRISELFGYCYWGRGRDVQKYSFAARRSRECGRGIKESGESADERDHGMMPKAVEAKEVHLFDGVLCRPLLRGYAISRDENAGAVFA